MFFDDFEPFSSFFFLSPLPLCPLPRPPLGAMRLREQWEHQKPTSDDEEKMRKKEKKMRIFMKERS